MFDDNYYLIAYDKWIYLLKLNLLISNYKRNELLVAYEKLLKKEITHKDYYDNYNSYCFFLIKEWNTVYYY